MVLSDAGRLLLTHARRTMLESESVLQEIAALKGAARDEIRVASVAGVARTFLPAAMARFRQDWPDMRFDLRGYAQGSAASRGRGPGRAGHGLQYGARRRPGRALLTPRAGPCGDGGRPSAGGPRQREPAGSGRLPDGIDRTRHDHAAPVRTGLRAGVGADRARAELQRSSPLHGFVYGSDAIMLGGYISVTHSLDRDQLVAVPISNAELQSRTCRFR